ncbi:MAG TPA: arginine--tRNA ligase [Candidatus Nanoarchaeia archaeon]|nr:arginine--tRNA ligase [Candidatus Nanoarchaeia archaeon]
METGTLPLKDKFKTAIVELLARQLGVSAGEIVPKIEMPADDALGDYAFPCFFIAKIMKKSPAAIASELAPKLRQAVAGVLIEDIKAAGPYVNFFINKAELARAIITAVAVAKGSYGSHAKIDKTVMVEYFHANTHKAVHLGHVRNICLGESLCRILEFGGMKVIRVNYQGDIGPHVAKCLWGILNLKGFGTPPATNRLRWLGNVYVETNTLVEGDEKLEAEVKQLLLRIYEGNNSVYKLWRVTRQWCLDEFEEMYSDFGVKYAEFYFESDVEFEARKISRQLVKDGIAQESEGAIIVDLKPHKLGVFVLVTNDGTALYSSKDIALAREKLSKYRLDWSIHVVGREQELHFKQLFKTLELMGGKEKDFAAKSFHLIYGLVMLPSGKMSSRAGTVVFYDDLRNELVALATEEVRKRHSGWKEPEVAAAARKIAFAALKFGMINRDNEKELVFDWEQAMKLEGETGPYVQYAYARICSIFRKHGKQLLQPDKADYAALSTTAEIKVIKLVKAFPTVVSSAAAQLKPALVSRYLLDLAQAFNNFYNDHPILNAEPQQRDARLLLCAAVRQVLENGLHLLAIDPLEEM